MFYFKLQRVLELVFFFTHSKTPVAIKLMQLSSAILGMWRIVWGAVIRTKDTGRGGEQ